MSFNFDWNLVSAGAPYITISDLGIGINLPAAALLGNPDTVIVGFDEQKMALGIKKPDGIQNAKTYKFCSRLKNGWIRIGCKDFIKYLSMLSGLKFNPAIRFIAHYDEAEDLLYISILEAVSDSSVMTVL